jgi:N-acylneuraminate cytidylyltransferase
MPNLCIIPARGGSKRIPRKNIKDFLGKPIIAYSIEAALHSGLFDEVMVSTDDKEIAEIALKFGAKVPFMRSPRNSDDFASTYDVIYEVIIKYKEILNKEFSSLCCIYSCAPFVSKEILIEGFQKLNKDNFDSVFPIVPYSFPIQRALSLNDGKISMIDEKYLITRSQDLEDKYHDAGQFYWCNTEKLILNSKILTKNSGSIVVSELKAQDIDTEIDWKLAELKFKLAH